MHCLERIFLYLCNVSSEIISIEAITKELNGVSRTTVENYIQYLESANLIYQSWPVDMAGKKVLKARPKIYIADAAIRNAVLMNDSILTDPVEMGKIVETAVYKHMLHAVANIVPNFQVNVKVLFKLKIPAGNQEKFGDYFNSPVPGCLMCCVYGMNTI